MSKRWYVVHTYSGYENRVKSDLEHRIETMGMQDRIFDIEIPMERVTEIKEGGKRETKDSKIFPASPVSWAATASPLRFPATSTTR